MFILQSEFEFDAAHRLIGHKGKCARLHGHRWRVIVQIKSQQLKEEGTDRDMVIDFSDLRKDLKELENIFDHKVIEEGKVFQVNDTTVIVPFRPTAERLAQFIYKRIEEKGHQVHEVKVFETPKNAVTYME
ncbi:6-carboxytetrahydropterin synthase QueD [Desulfitibacter alkalitolerans]|uniref:6-carboxytetrahydropterin synthase QueD n=1 Tax=Desulfitibacter alkalitolerans TaxID=264641 RepID=UPI0004885F0F|nr:6-carboxytetrahydropterin synthase QueD [Desulfitibacter alkalitolerans]